MRVIHNGLQPIFAGAELNTARKTFTEGTHRVCTPYATLNGIVPRLGAFGVTRIANVTGLDYLGIPVTMAIRPNSGNLSTYQGKGLSLDAAKVSAIMEAYEYACAEAPRSDAIWAGTSRLGQSRRIMPRHLVRGRLCSDVELPWVSGIDLMSGGSVLVPEEMISTDYRRPRRRGFGIFGSTSNGLASGNTDDEAMLHAVCELIERDALALWKQAPSTHRMTTCIDPRQSADWSVKALMDRFDAAAMQVEVWEITSDIEVPAFYCVIDDVRGEPPFLGRFGGAGCHPSTDVALCRALAEAAQSRLTYIVGTRDDISIDSYELVDWQHNLASLIADQPPPRGVAGRSPRAVSFDTDSIDEDLRGVLARLSARGIDCVVRIDLTLEAIGLPCVRLVSPDLEGMSNKAGYRPGKRARRARRAWN
jgi:YcaO-like protein with predicted kinase domain